MVTLSATQTELLTDHLELPEKILRRLQRSHPIVGTAHADFHGVAQDALMTASRTFMPGRSSFSTWATLLIERRVLQTAKRQAHRQSQLEKRADALAIDNRLERNWTPLYDALDRLPDESREIIALHFGLRGKNRVSVAQIGLRMGMDKATVLDRIASAVKLLGSMLLF
jgi:RNA polymerase sigma factor (sigma-70 family)